MDQREANKQFRKGHRAAHRDLKVQRFLGKMAARLEIRAEKKRARDKERQEARAIAYSAERARLEAKYARIDAEATDKDREKERRPERSKRSKGLLQWLGEMFAWFCFAWCCVLIFMLFLSIAF